MYRDINRRIPIPYDEMAVFKGSGIFPKEVFVVFRCSVLLLAANYQCTECKADDILMWTAPPPAWNQTNPGTSLANIRTAVYQVRNGSTNVLLRWNYTLLPGQTLHQTTFSIGDGISQDDIGFVNTGSTGILYNTYRDRFSIYSTSQFSNLTISKVTVQDNATFQCKLSAAIMGVDLWAYNIRVEVTVQTSLTGYSGDQTVNEGSNLTLFCNATGKPSPSTAWTRVLKNGTDGEQVFFGNPWIIVNISRTATGTYRCTAYNGIGNPVNHSLYINVTYQPDMVTLITNTTENKDCSDLWVNFTCISSETNPPVYNYLLSDDENGFSLSKSGTWVKKISRGGKSIYSCLAFQLVENVTSARNITLTVNVPASVQQVENKNVIEGDNVEEFCNVTVGDPDPAVMWTNDTSGEHIEGNPLNITNINRAQAGDYKCTANNTCGEVSTVMNINVQYGPENVILTTNTTSKVCTGVVINFTCTAEANPPVHTYLLYENETMIKNMGISGTWIKTMENAGHFVFRCKANNSIQGIGRSGNTTLTVDVPASVKQAKGKNVTEGDNVEEYCNAAAGIPDPTVMWTNVKTGKHIKENPLNITNINRTQAGEYKCTANNTCGVDSTVMNIDVQYGPENVILTTNTTSKVCTRVLINFTCTAEANPAVHTYLLYENDTMIKNMGISGIWIKTMENAGHFVFRCEANNSIQGIGKSGNTTLTVDVPASVEQAKNKNVTEGDNVEVYCNVTAGIPDPTVMWTIVMTGEHIKENLLNVTNINRTQAGNYKCTANNTCGEAFTVMNINVQYPPDIFNISHNQIVNETDVVNLTCEADANPRASINWTRVSDNSPVFFPLTITGKQDEGGYRCTADNGIQDPARKTVNIAVENHHPIETELGPDVNSVILNKTFNITCSAKANPAAKYRLYKNQESFRNYTSGNETVAVIVTSVRERVLKVNYSCTPYNKFGDGPREEISLSVFFPPFVIDGNHTEFVSQEKCPVSISCPVRGSPEPNITWYKGNDSSNVIIKASTLELPVTVCRHGGLYTYTCFAKNHLGNVTGTKKVLVETPGPTTPSPTTPSIPTSKESIIYATAKIDTSFDERDKVEKEIPRLACELTKNKTCVSAKALDSRPGSIILDFEMKFNQSVVASEVLSVLKKAAENDEFGGFKVDPNSIKQISPPTTGTTSTKEPACSGFFQKEDCDINLVVVIVIAVAGLIVICIIVGIIAWWVHKRRKCRKDTRVHHSTSEERPFSRENSTPGDDSSYSQVNNGYAKVGPQSSQMTSLAKHQEASGPATAPDYAVVDKSAKKGKKKDKKVKEQKLAAEPPQYAAVDKSKKKKKGEPDATYAQVDTSKKSKKKPKPGEVLYADLGDFQQMQELPAVSTSPQALPPIKKPTPYGETQYADITQFLKGDATLPESNNSQGPDTGTQAAPAPGNGNSQEPGTSTKETSQASNPGGDGGPDHETNF